MKRLPYIFIGFLLVAAVPAHAFTVLDVSKNQASAIPYQTSSSNTWIPIVEFQGTGSFDTVCMIPGFAGSPGSIGTPIEYYTYKLDAWPTFTSGVFHGTDINGTLPAGNTDSDPAAWEFVCSSFSTPINFSPGDSWAIAFINPGGTAITDGSQASPYSYLRTAQATGSWGGTNSNFGPVSPVTASFNFSVPLIISLGPPGPSIENTVITTVTPPNDPTGVNALATSTTFAFGATGNVHDNDYREGMYLKISYENNVAAASLAVGPAFSDAGNALCSWLPNWMCPGAVDEYELSGSSQGSIVFPITSAGAFSFSTSTDMQIIGRHTMTTAIWQPGLSVAGISIGDSVFVATTTAFTVATSSSYDRAVGQTVEAILNMNQVAANPPVCYFDITTPANYFSNIAECIQALSVVAADTVASSLQTYMGDLLSRAPWGYATRVFVILTNNTGTSTLPSIAVAVPDGLPMEGSTFDFSPWGPIESAVSLIDNTEVETIDGSPLVQFEFWWNVMWSLIFAFWLMRELYGAYELGDFDDDRIPVGRGGSMGRGIAAYKMIAKDSRAYYREGVRGQTVSNIRSNQNAMKRYIRTGKSGR